jgi:hypothetical protein
MRALASSLWYRMESRIICPVTMLNKMDRDVQDCQSILEINVYVISNIGSY